MIDSNLRARSISEIVDAAFSLYRQHFLQYVMVTAIAYSPVLVLTLLSPKAMQPQTPSDLLAVVPIYLVSFITMSLVAGVVARMGSDVYLGRDPDVARTLRDVVPRVPALIIASLLNALLLVIGFVFLVVPGVYVFVRNFAVWPAIVLERVGPFKAFSRSGALSKGHKWHILGTLALSYGIYMVLSWGVLFLMRATGSLVVTVLASSLFNVFAYPVVNLVTTVLYYDCRIRNEGFDLEHMTSALDA